MSLINFVASLLGAGGIQAFKTMRTLRALRPLRAMSRMQGMRVRTPSLHHKQTTKVVVLVVDLYEILVFVTYLEPPPFTYCISKAWFTICFVYFSLSLHLDLIA